MSAEFTTLDSDDGCDVGNCSEGTDYRISVDPHYIDSFTMDVCEGHEFEFTGRAHIERVKEL